MQQIAKNTNMKIPSEPPQLMNSDYSQIPFQAFLPFIPPQSLPLLPAFYGINPLNYPPQIAASISKNMASKQILNQMKIPDNRNPNIVEPKESENQSQIQQFSQLNDTQSNSEQEQQFFIDKKETKRDNPPRKIISNKTNDSDQLSYLSVDVKDLDKDSKFKRLNTMRQHAALCFIQYGNQKEAFQCYLKKTFPRMNDKNIKVQSSTYKFKVFKLLSKIPQKTFDFLELSFNLKIQPFTHKQILRLVKYLKYYKGHFSLQQQKLIVQLLKSFVLLQKAPTSKQSLQGLYRTFKRLLRSPQKIEDLQIQFLKVRINSISDFLRLREKQIKAKLLKKQDKIQSYQEKIRRKRKRQLVNSFRRIQNMKQLKQSYRWMSPEAHGNSLITETKYLLKQVFLQAIYNLQQKTTNLEIKQINKYFLYTKSWILLEKTLTPTYRNLALLLIDIYDEIGELQHQKVVFYVNKLKQAIKNIRQSSLNSVADGKKHDSDQKRAPISKWNIKDDKIVKGY